MLTEMRPKPQQNLLKRLNLQLFKDLKLRHIKYETTKIIFTTLSSFLFYLFIFTFATFIVFGGSRKFN